MNNNNKIRRVPYFKYFQKNLAILFYNFWIIKDNPDCILINFMYHGELSLPKKINYIYILQNKSNLDELYVTYNINTEFKPPQPLEDTILIHRKKESNTLYTINALNQLVREENGGVLDKTFVIDWQKFRNSIILTNTEGTKRIQTRIFEVIEFNQK